MAREKTRSLPKGVQEVPEVEATQEVVAEVQTPVAQAGRVKVCAVRGPFVDLIKDVMIGGDPVEVEMHPWLQAQVVAGHLKLV